MPSIACLEPDSGFGGAAGLVPAEPPNDELTPSSAERRLRGRLVAGRYLIQRMVGAGAMGYVYRALRVDLGVPCAVKVMRDPAASEPTARAREAVARFQLEAHALSRLRHPNIVQLLDFGRDADADLWYLVTEHLDGRDWTEVLDEGSALPTPRIVALMRQLCAALQHAHEAGVVHRDVKPDNLRLVPCSAPGGNSTERVKLLDFGTAILVSGASSAMGAPPGQAGLRPQTPPPMGAPPGQAGLRPQTPPPWEDFAAADLERPVMGTPAYMSPEQATGRGVDARSDIYSCGVLLFEMATGRLPFDDAPPIALAAAHVEQEPPAPSSFHAGIDPELEALILRCLRKDPAERPRSARDLRDALDRLAGALQARRP
jgi:serine/threonine-protein kinase